MAIVRELTTLLDFKVDKSGFTQAEAAVNQIKSSVIALGKIFGIVFAADKLIEMVDSLKNAGKEVAKLEYQLSRMARPGDDVVAAQKQLFQIAQNTGMEYIQTLDVFREFLNESKELNVSQDQIVNSIENIYKGLRLGAASTEEIHQTFEALNRGFRLGRIGMRQFGLLTDIAPEVIDAIARSLGKTREQLQEMAKDSKLTADVLIKALGTPNQKLAEDFAKRARKLGEGFTYAWNELVVLSRNLFKLLNSGSLVADMMVRLTDIVKAALLGINSYFGGLKKVIEDLGILVGVVIGGKFVNAVRLAVLWTATWTNALKLLKFAIRGLGVLALTEGIIDLVAWMRGGKSFIGDFLGEFDDVMAFIGEKLSTDKLLGSLNALTKLLQGDYTGSWNALLETFNSLEGVIGNIITLLGIMSVLSFFNITKALFGIGRGLLGIGKGAAAVAPTAAATGAEAVATGAGAAAGGAAVAKPSLLARLFRFGLRGAALPLLLSGDTGPTLTPEQLKASKENNPIVNAWNAMTDWIGSNKTDLFTMLPSPSLLPNTAGVPATAAPGAQSVVGIGTQTNNVEIKIDPAFNLTDIIKNAMEDVMAKWSRDARNANPLTEAGRQ